MAYELSKQDIYNINCAIHDAYIPLTIDPAKPRDKNHAVAMRRIAEHVPVPRGVNYHAFMSAASIQAHAYLDEISEVEGKNRALMEYWEECDRKEKKAQKSVAQALLS